MIFKARLYVAIYMHTKTPELKVKNRTAKTIENTPLHYTQSANILPFQNTPSRIEVVHLALLGHSMTRHRRIEVLTT